MTSETLTSETLTSETPSGHLSRKRPKLRRAQKVTAARTWANTVAIGLVALVFTFPFIWMFFSALKPESEVFSSTPSFIGSEVKWSNFVDAWTLVPFGRFIFNGFFVSTVGALLSVIVAVLSAYAFSRLRFKYRDRIFLLYVLTLVLPQEVLVVPLFIMMNQLGLVDSYAALIIPFAFTAFGTFLLRQFFLTIPIEYEEAALHRRRLAVPHVVVGAAAAADGADLGARGVLVHRLLQLLPLAADHHQQPGARHGSARPGDVHRRARNPVEPDDGGVDPRDHPVPDHRGACCSGS